MKVPILDLKPQYQSIKSEIDAAMQRVVESQYFILGPEVAALEEAVAAYCHCQSGIGVSSGTDALLCSLMAIDVGPGDEVILPTFTFFATAGVVARLGATPVFVDIEPDTYNIDPAAVAKAITGKTKAIIVVHLFGQCAEMDPILALAKDKGLRVIEDGAQAIGSEYHGRRAGSMGDLGCLSFFPTKNLGGFGDGGMIVTTDATLGDRCRSLRVHGAGKRKYYHDEVGGNFRLDALQAAILGVKLKHLDDWTAGRQKHGAYYTDRFTGTRVVPPTVRDSNRMIYNQYVVRVPNRDQVQATMKERGVGTMIYYPLPLHMQDCFGNLGYKAGDMPVAEKAASEVLALPVYSELAPEQVEMVASTLLEVVG